MEQIARITKKYYCGIDLHAKNMYVCTMNAKGKVLFHRQIANETDALLAVLEPYLRSIVVGVESTYNWYWLADFCTDYNIDFCLGHALYIKRKIGRKHANDKRDSNAIANLLRIQDFPLAYPYPAGMRETRDLFRRRITFVRKRAAAYTHIQTLFGQQGMIAPKLLDLQRKSDRRKLINAIDRVECKFSLECDFDYIESLDPLIARIEKNIHKKALRHNRKAFSLLMTIPGCGDMLTLTILYETHNIRRFAIVQNFSSYSRVVKAQRDSCGKAKAGAGQGESKIGNPYLKWAFSQIAVHAIMFSAPILKQYEKSKRKFGIQKALARLEHKFAVAVYYMLKNGTVFDEKRFVTGK